MPDAHSNHRARLAARRLATLGAAIALAGVLTMAGCSHRTAATNPADVSSSTIAAAPSPSETPVGSATAAASTATTRLAPTLLSIPAIGVNSSLVRLGLAKDGTLEVPTQAMTAGWYTGSPVPGLVGPSVIAGHVHWSGIPAVFAHARRPQARRPRHRLPLRRQQRHLHRRPSRHLRQDAVPHRTRLRQHHLPGPTAHHLRRIRSRGQSV